jgi:hypothetical protein
MRTQYRVTWKRAGRSERRKTFPNAALLHRFLLLIGPEPWRAYHDGSGHAFACCRGHDCSCGGRTDREVAVARRAELNLTPLQWIRVESRQVSLYKLAPWPAEAVDGIETMNLQPLEPDEKWEGEPLAPEGVGPEAA